MLKFFVLSAFSLGGFALALASEIPSVPAKRLSKPPVIDGVISKEEWSEAPFIQGFVDSVTGKPVADDTQIWLAFDKDAIYLAIYAKDSKPDEIVGREIKPGSDFDGEDIVEFQINPQGNRTFSGRNKFLVNSLNTKSEEISGGRASKREWIGEWTSGTQRVADGWTVEIRITWKMLNYPSGANRTMDINFFRFQARTKIESKWADNTTQEKSELDGIWEGVQPPAPASPRPSFLAYTAPEIDDGIFRMRSGLDVRYPFTSQITGLVSINPDFKNIESDIAGIEFSRTERYLDEARPFFNEGGGLFRIGGFPFGFGQMFYSRRVQNFDWGAKVFGQVDPTLTFGALATVDTGDQLTSLMRVGKTFAPRRSLNAWYTGVERRGTRNQAFGFSGNYGDGNYSTSLNVATSRNNRKGSPTAGDASFSYSVPHWFATAKYQWIPPSFDSPVAYVPWVDRRGAYLYFEHNNEYRTGGIRQVHADWFTSYYEDYRGGQQEKGTEAGFSATTRSDIQLGTSISRYSYFGAKDETQTLRATFNESNRFKQYSIYHNWGERGGRATKYTSVGASYRLLPGLDLGLNWSLFNFAGEDRLTVGTVSYELGPLDSISGRFVNRNGNTNAYLAYRHSGGNGLEYFVILGDPNAEKWRSRVSFKIVYAF